MKKDDMKRDSEFNRFTENFTDLRKSEFQGTNQEFFEENSAANPNNDEKAENSHKKLLRKMSYLVVSVIAAVNIFSTTDDLKRNLKKYGGTVDRDFRFTVQWNEDGKNEDDLDIMCIEPDGYGISFLNLNTMSPSGGFIDIDIRMPDEKFAVENIVYKNKDTMKEGTYVLSVKCYERKGGTGGFKAQVEIMGKTYNFKYTKNLSEKETITVAKVVLKDGKFTLGRILE